MNCVGVTELKRPGDGGGREASPPKATFAAWASRRCVSTQRGGRSLQRVAHSLMRKEQSHDASSEKVQPRLSDVTFTDLRRAQKASRILSEPSQNVFASSDMASNDVASNDVASSDVT